MTFLGNVQGQQNGKSITPQEICVLDARDNSFSVSFHRLHSLAGLDAAAVRHIVDHIHGIPPDFGGSPDAIRGNLREFMGDAPCVLYVKGPQQLNTFKSLVGPNVTVISMGHIPPSDDGDRCVYHEKRPHFNCALQRCQALRRAFLGIREDRVACFFHGRECRQPENTCNLLWGTGTLENPLWSPACLVCQHEIHGRGDHYFCRNPRCTKFRHCLAKRVKDIWASGIRLTEEEKRMRFEDD